MLSRGGRSGVISRREENARLRVIRVFFPQHGVSIPFSLPPPNFLQRIPLQVISRSALLGKPVAF
jgi:hypothetical protein